MYLGEEERPGARTGRLFLSSAGDVNTATWRVEIVPPGGLKSASRASKHLKYAVEQRLQAGSCSVRVYEGNWMRGSAQ